MSTRDLLLKPLPVKVEPVHVPELDATFYVRTVSAYEKDQFELRATQYAEATGKPMGNVRARFAVLVLCDQDGKPEFTQDDEDLLSRQSGVVLDRIMRVGAKLNSFSKKDLEELGNG